MTIHLWKPTLPSVTVALGLGLCGPASAAVAAEANQPPSGPADTALNFMVFEGPLPADVREGLMRPPTWDFDQCGNRWALSPSREPGGPQVTVSTYRNSWTLTPPCGTPLPAVELTMLRADAYSFVWVAGRAGLWRFDPRNPNRSWLSFPGEDKLGSVVTAMGRGPNGLLLVGTEDGSLFEVDFTAKGEPQARKFVTAGLSVKGRAIPSIHTDRVGAIWIPAGRNGLTPDNTAPCCRAEPAADAWQKHWEELPEMFFGTHDVFGAELGGKLYIPGGMASHGLPARFTYFAEMFVFDASANAWSMTAPMTKPLCYSGVAVLDGKAWVVGGGENQESDPNRNQKRVAVDLVHIFDPATGLWTMGPPLPEPRMESVVAAVGGRIYCIGGNVPGKASTTVVSLASGEKVWREDSSVPSRILQSSGCVLDGILYVAAHQKGLMAYNPAANNWDTTLPRIPGLVPSAAFCAAYKGEVWVMGGYRDKGATPGAVWRYRPKSREWRAGPTLPMPLCWGAAAEVGGKLIIAGGGFGSHGTYVFPNRAFRLKE
jgi:hypothetical protein